MKAKMPRRLFLALLIGVLAAAALTIWVASSFVMSVPTWVFVLLPVTALLARHLWTRTHPMPDDNPNPRP